MIIEPIAIFESPLTTKFGIPRQSGIASRLVGRIVLQPAFRQGEGLRGLEDFDYLWLIWGFSENVDAVKHSTVRPPLLGGNERVGVWATRSPFRPNNLGLSSVRILSVDAKAGLINVAGADLMNGTPIFDIKPYLPYADSHPDARGGFTDSHFWQCLAVDMPDSVRKQLPPSDCEALIEILALDPRPQYHDDPLRIYGMQYAGFDVRFRVAGNRLLVIDAKKT